MKWTKFKIETLTDAEDIAISTLYDYGFEGAQIEDKVPLTALEKEQMFVDIPPEPVYDDGIAYISFFVETDSNGTLRLNGEELSYETVLYKINEAVEEIKSYGIDIGSGKVSVSETEDIDWINNWKQYFHQFTVDDVLIIPSWENVKPSDKDKLILHIDPGTAFGTGAHETTQLCIRQLRKYVKKDTELLDIGTGSGILAILSLMFGAKHAVGTDLDPCAVTAVSDNIKQNNIPEESFDLLIGNIITDKEIKDSVGYEKYDIAVANILAEVLVPLSDEISRHLKCGGLFITSGIIDGREAAVRTAMLNAGFEIKEETSQGEWHCITAVKV